MGPKTPEPDVAQYFCPYSVSVKCKINGKLTIIFRKIITDYNYSLCFYQNSLPDYYTLLVPLFLSIFLPRHQGRIITMLL